MRLTFIAYPSCSGGDGYQLLPEAAEACTTPARGPRAVDLLVAHLTGRLNGTFAAPAGGRVVRAGASGSGAPGTADR